VRMKVMGHQTPSMDIRHGIVDRHDINVARERLSRKTSGKVKRVK
jgi:hypothetical protein